jgi:hypothetical protein
MRLPLRPNHLMQTNIIMGGNNKTRSLVILEIPAMFANAFHARMSGSPGMGPAAHRAAGIELPVQDPNSNRLELLNVHLMRWL